MVQVEIGFQGSQELMWMIDFNMNSDPIGIG
jgi:hypothetical protein